MLVRDPELGASTRLSVSVADTVGSGDAFTAGLVHEYLRGAPFDLMNEVANLVGAWVTGPMWCHAHSQARRPGALARRDSLIKHRSLARGVV